MGCSDLQIIYRQVRHNVLSYHDNCLHCRCELDFVGLALNKLNHLFDSLSDNIGGNSEKKGEKGACSDSAEKNHNGIQHHKHQKFSEHCLKDREPYKFFKIIRILRLDGPDCQSAYERQHA